MDLYTIVSILVTTSILIAYLNYRFIGMQTTIAIMTASLGLSLVIIILQHTGLCQIGSFAKTLIQRTDFQNVLLKGMLSFLLFAGALSIDLEELKKQKWEIGILASVSTIASTLLIGLITFALLPLLGLPIPFLYCLIFGALISPTDPIAVLATFKELGLPKRIQTTVAGESLFNDGVGIVIFTSLYQLAFTHADITVGSVTALFLKQTVGGLVYGLLLGVFTSWLITPVKGNKIITLLTIAMVSGGYSFALWLDVSGPLAMVVFGMYLRNHIHKYASKPLYDTLYTFWELVDEILNAILFFLIGLEMLTIHLGKIQLIAIAFAIPLVLVVRLITVALPLKPLQGRASKHQRASYTIGLLTWGGLRGGLALALVLSLPRLEHLDTLIALTYGIVAFSVIVQGLTIKPLARLTHR